LKNSSTKPTFIEEEFLWEKGFRYIIGIDEVGRGCFAGPIVAGAVVFKKDCNRKLLIDVNDSKQLKFLQRRKLSKVIKDECLYWGIGTIPVSTINKVGIGKANKIAFRKALDGIIKNIGVEKPFVLIDGFHVKYIRGVGLKNEKAIIRGDQRSITIAAASIIAKDHRDKIMRTLSKKYPEYGFGKNKGYGTKEHQDAIKKHGLTRIHRTSFNLGKFI
jgi:ribonuclease HII